MSTARPSWRWLLPVIALVALGAVTIAFAIVQLNHDNTADSAPEPSPPTTPSQAPAADSPATGTDPSTSPSTSPSAGASPDASAIPIASRVDPSWVASMATATGIPERALAAYAGATLAEQEKAPNCGLGWNTLAAIGQVESQHGSLHKATLAEDGSVKPRIIGPALDGGKFGRIRDTDHGKLDHDRTWDHAVGPMQFLPQSWKKWAADGDLDGTRDIDQIDDAALAAADYLCADNRNLADSGTWQRAIGTYNAGIEYAAQVATTANQYAAAASAASGTSATP